MWGVTGAGRLWRFLPIRPGTDRSSLPILPGAARPIGAGGEGAPGAGFVACPARDRGALATTMAPVLRGCFRIHLGRREASLKMQDFFRPLARAFSFIPAEMAGSHVRLCRAEG